MDSPPATSRTSEPVIFNDDPLFMAPQLAESQWKCLGEYDCRDGLPAGIRIFDRAAEFVAVVDGYVSRENAWRAHVQMSNQARADGTRNRQSIPIQGITQEMMEPHSTGFRLLWEQPLRVVRAGFGQWALHAERSAPTSGAAMVIQAPGSSPQGTRGHLLFEMDDPEPGETPGAKILMTGVETGIERDVCLGRALVNASRQVSWAMTAHRIFVNKDTRQGDDGRIGKYQFKTPKYVFRYNASDCRLVVLQIPGLATVYAARSGKAVMEHNRPIIPTDADRARGRVAQTNAERRVPTTVRPT